MTRQELEAINTVVDQIGAGLDALCDLLSSIEEGKKTQRRKEVLASISSDCASAPKKKAKGRK